MAERTQNLREQVTGGSARTAPASARNKDLKKMSFSMNTKNVVSKNEIKKEHLCALCQGVLVNPWECKECKNRFHQTCLNNFAKETGQCPMQCAKPRFINITVQIAKELRNVKFVCNNSDLGCPKILNYEEVAGHADQCRYMPVKCQAYNKCKTKCIRMEIEKHQAVCPNLQVPCIYCRNYVERMNIITHEQEECTGTYTCGKCGMVIIKEETQKNTHNCFNALAGYLQNMLQSKDYVITVFKEEIARKNRLIEQLFSNQEKLEKKLAQIEEVLSYDEKQALENKKQAELKVAEEAKRRQEQAERAKQRGNAPPQTPSYSESTHKNELLVPPQAAQQQPQVTQPVISQPVQPLVEPERQQQQPVAIQQQQDDKIEVVEEEGEKFVKETSEERADKTLNALAEVSEEYHEAFSEAQDLPDELVKFFELQDWAEVQKNADSSLLTRTSERNLLCLASTAVISTSMEKLTKVLVNGTHRKAFDKHFETAELILNLPLDTRVFYMKMKKIMVVGARDMVLIQKVKQIDQHTTVIVVKSVEKLADEKHPVSDSKDLQRAIVHIGGYLLKQEGANQTKLTVLNEMDYKIAQFMAKNVGLKSGNMAKQIKDYVQKNNL